MTERLFNMKSLILSGVFLFFTVCDSARANYDGSSCHANGNVNIQNINLKGGQYLQGQELQKIIVPISYTCTTTASTLGSFVYSPTVSFSGMKQVADALEARGFGMDIVAQEEGGALVTFTWKEIKAGFSGWSSSKAFGACMDPEKVYNRSGTITLRIFVEQVFNNNFLNINIPGSSINIYPYSPTQNGISVGPPNHNGAPLTVSAFNMRLIPENSGRVIISPSTTINMGRFYTEYKETMMPKEVTFTVTAQQNIGTKVPFVAPLAIEFQTNGLTLADADSSVTLKNTKGEYNGFRLSVMDEAGIPVKFNTKADMGNISLDNASGGKIIKQYKAKVEAIPGAEIKTGNFSAAMTVVVTYI